MTPEERLAIAEEVAYEGLPVRLVDMEVRKSLDGERQVCIYRLTGEFLLEAVYVAGGVYLARQKLAAEKEAAMTPNERKYRKALQDIAGHVRNNMACDVSINIAEEALKESP